MDTVTVIIFGESYTVKSIDDPEYVQEVARYVDGKMNDISGTGKAVTTSKVAILTALNIADELFKARRDSSEREEEAGRKIEKLLRTLQDAVKDES